MLHNFNKHLFALNNKHIVVSNGTDITIPFRCPVRLQKKKIMLVFSLIALFGFIGGITGEIVLFRLEPMTTLLIIPERRVITATTTLTVVANTPQSSQVPGRMLSMVAIAQEKTVATTGSGHQDARTAYGWITLYNALPIKQIVPLGTVLVGLDGVQVLTEREAVIPAGSLLTNGQVSVPAHTVIKGARGNIAARDIYGSCCRANVFAQNVNAFVGGQGARTFSTVSSQDVSDAVSILKNAVQQDVQTALAVQVHEDETLITPISCFPQISMDHAVGMEAKQVSVIINEFCTGEVYITYALHALVVQAVNREAARHVEIVPMFLGDITEHVEDCTVINQHQGMFRLQVKGVGVFRVHFTREQLQHMAVVLVGMPSQEAVRHVLHIAGIKSVSVHVVDSQATNCMPNDPQHIQLVIAS